MSTPLKPVIAMLASLAFAPGLLLAPGQAAAQELLDATDPERVAEILKGFGMARLSEDSVGDPQVEGRVDGQSYRLFFYGCTEGADCTSVQFWAYWDIAPHHEAINTWNKDTRYGTVYIDADGDLVLEYDVNLAFGIADRTFEDSADIWARLITSVEEHFDTGG